MNLDTILKNNALKLKKFGIKNPHFEAEILLSFILKKQREFILAHPEIKLSQNQIKNYNTLIARRLKGEPIAYIIGKKSFYGLDFIVNKNVLVPRPETELMVEEALKCIARAASHTANSNCLIIDVGTGTGCIIISLAKNLPQNKNIAYLAVDISKKALEIAQKNAKRHKAININFSRGDLLKPIFANKLSIFKNNQAANIIICANLPYLTPAQIKASPSIQYEPKKALTAGPDGLKYYCQLFRQIKRIHKIYPTVYHIFCEIDPGQTAKIKQLAHNELPQFNFKIKKDLKGHNRLAIISSS